LTFPGKQTGGGSSTVWVTSLSVDKLVVELCPEQFMSWSLEWNWSQSSLDRLVAQGSQEHIAFL
jgi:hypothetical protein